MSCQLKYVSKIDNDCIEIIKSTFLDSDTAGNKRSDIRSQTRSEQRNSLDLRNSIVALSPHGEFLAVAHQKTLLILAAKWDALEEDGAKIKYKQMFLGNVCQNPNERITALICLPLVLFNKSSQLTLTRDQCTIDWTCIAVGFDTGYLRFYDESGQLLLSEQVHDEPIKYLKCQSFHPSRSSSHDEFQEELYVILRTMLINIPGFGLFQTLRACRSQLAKAQANCATPLEPPPLCFRKWAFVEQGSLNDCAVIGPSATDTFDHLLTASIRGGFGATYRSGAPKSTLVVAVGESPFIGFHFAFEGVDKPNVLVDVAQAMASKLKGWLLSGNKSATEKQRANAVEPIETTMGHRFGLCDRTRKAVNVLRSPNREYSVITDALGRVTLVNNARGIAVRMWKGYRNAQCGWLLVEEEEPPKKSMSAQLPRTVLFLVIYDPRKGLLEVYLTPHGSRITAFSCTKHGRLVYTGHGLVGLNNKPVNWANCSLSPCVFIDDKGRLSEVIVPFHCALSDESGERAADLSHLRKLRKFLSETEGSSEEIAQEVGLTATELKTTEIRIQTLDMLVSNRHVTPSILEAALAVFIDKVSTEGSTGQLKSAEQTLLLKSKQLYSLTGFYNFVDHQREKPPAFTSVVPEANGSDLQAVADKLNATVSDILKLKSLLSLCDTSDFPRREARVTFEDNTDKSSSFVDFLSCFDIGKTETPTSENNTVIMNTIDTRSINIRNNLSLPKLNTLAELLFQGLLYSELSMAEWKKEIRNSGILNSCLLRLVVHFWLTRRLGQAVEFEMMRLGDIISAICSFEECGKVSALWQSVRLRLIESSKPLNAFSAALVCRAVAIYIDGKTSTKDKDKKVESEAQSGNETEVHSKCNEEESSDEQKREKENDISSRKTSGGVGEWENVSWDIAQWSLLIGRLEDVSLLNSIITRSNKKEENFAKKSGLSNFAFEKSEISLASLLRRGKGSVAEIVAKWLISTDIDIKLLTALEDDENNIDSPIKKGKKNSKDQSDKGGIQDGIPIVLEKGIEVITNSENGDTGVLELIKLLRRHFPFSLSCVSLLANLSWEYMLIWDKHPNCIYALEQTLACLQVVPCVHVRQGVCCLMWSKFIKPRFQALVTLLDNLNDKYCLRNMEISEANLAPFASVCLQFIDTFIEASNLSEVIRPPGPESSTYRCEDIWTWSDALPEIRLVTGSSEYTSALIHIAFRQHQAQYEQLHLLLQLALAVHMMLALNIRGIKLKPIFSPEEQSAFFSDLSPSFAISQRPPNARVKRNRNLFLSCAISAAMQGIISTDPFSVSKNYLRSEMSGAMQWTRRCQELAHSWHLSIDPLRRHQVCLLYSYGHDDLAEEILPSVTELDVLASQLLLIAGQRMKLYLVESRNMSEEMSALSPELSVWVLDLNTTDVRSVPLRLMKLLLVHVVQHLPADHPEYNMAVSLSDAARTLSILQSEET